LGALPPGTQAEAQLFPSSLTWQGAEGAYQVALLNDVGNKYINPVPGAVGFADVPSLEDLDASTLFNRVCFAPLGINDNNASTPISSGWSNCTHMYPYDVSGLVLANPSQDQTYQLTVKYYMERIPTSSDPNLLVLSTESAPFDPMALEIYSRAMTHIPVAARVSENPMGEWFEKVMEIVASVAPTIGTLMTPVLGPAGPALGIGLGMASAVASGTNNAARRKIQKQEQEQFNSRTLRTQTGVTVRANPSTQRGRQNPKVTKSRIRAELERRKRLR